MKDVKYFECQKCHAIIEVKKPDVDKYVTPSWNRPSECYEDQGGCGRVAKFLEVKEEWIKAKREKLAKSKP